MVEYCVADVLELAGNCARDAKKNRINPRHVMLAMRNDDALNQFVEKVIIPHSGVLPNISNALLPKAKGSDLKKIK